MSESRRGRRRPNARMVALAFLAGWGPAIVIAVILYIVTGSIAVAGLTFAIATAITAVVYGAVGSVRMRRRQGR